MFRPLMQGPSAWLTELVLLMRSWIWSPKNIYHIVSLGTACPSAATAEGFGSLLSPKGAQAALAAYSSTTEPRPRSLGSMSMMGTCMCSPPLHAAKFRCLNLELKSSPKAGLDVFPPKVSSTILVPFPLADKNCIAVTHACEHTSQQAGSFALEST